MTSSSSASSMLAIGLGVMALGGLIGITISFVAEFSPPLKAILDSLM